MSRFPRGVHQALALAFIGATAVYGFIWMYAVRRQPVARMGVIVSAGPSGDVTLQDVVPGSPADRAGLRKGDVVRTVNGRAVDSVEALTTFSYDGRPGETIVLDVRRPGLEQALIAPVVLERAPPPPAVPRSHRLAFQVIRLHPVLFLAVAAAVLLLRPEDRNAWLLAGVLAGFIAGAPFFEDRIPPPLRGFALAYRIVISGAAPAVFFFLFAVFPARSPLDARFPWLKWLWLGGIPGSCPWPPRKRS